jgi:putative transposase
LGLNRSGLYYAAQPEKPSSLRLMRLIDEEYTRHPCKGVGQLTRYLRQEHHQKCGPKRVRRLMRKMGLEAVYPKPNTSRPSKQHAVYPYLLREVSVERVDQVWSADITYIRLGHGFAYLAAIMDWRSRAVLSWRLSNTMDAAFCCEALEAALAKHGRPEVFNTDQGSQFTSEGFLAPLIARGISISMDGRGRALDNVFVERLWRTVKYEDVYIKGYETLPQAQAGLAAYFEYYNHRRFHSSLEDRTPWAVYRGETLSAAA